MCRPALVLMWLWCIRVKYKEIWNSAYILQNKYKFSSSSPIIRRKSSSFINITIVYIGCLLIRVYKYTSTHTQYLMSLWDLRDDEENKNVSNENIFIWWESFCAFYCTFAIVIRFISKMVDFYIPICVSWRHLWIKCIRCVK